jgi:hypothetical protein
VIVSLASTAMMQDVGLLFHHKERSTCNDMIKDANLCRTKWFPLARMR